MSQTPEEDLVERMVGRHGEEAEDPVRDTIKEYNRAIDEIEEQHERELRETRRAAEESANTEGNVATAWGIGIGLIGGFFMIDIMNMDPFILPIMGILAIIAGVLLGL